MKNRDKAGHVSFEDRRAALSLFLIPEYEREVAGGKFCRLLCFP